MSTSTKKVIWACIAVCLLLFSHCIALGLGYLNGYGEGCRLVCGQRWREQKGIAEAILRKTNLRHKVAVDRAADGTAYMRGSLNKVDYALLRKELTELLGTSLCTFVLQDVKVDETDAIHQNSRDVTVHQEQGTKPQAEQPSPRGTSPERAVGSARESLLYILRRK